MDFSTEGQNRFYVCRVCGLQVRPRGVSVHDAPGTAGHGSNKQKLCCAHYKKYLRDNKGRPYRERVDEPEPEPRAPLTPDELAVARIAAGRVAERGELVQVLSILGLVNTPQGRRGMDARARKNEKERERQRAKARALRDEKEKANA